MEGLHIDVDDAAEPPGGIGVLGRVHGQVRVDVVNALDKEERQGAGSAATQDVLGKPLRMAGAAGGAEDDTSNCHGKGTNERGGGEEGHFPGEQFMVVLDTFFRSLSSKIEQREKSTTVGMP